MREEKSVGKSHTVRLDEQTEEKLQNIMKVRGITCSTAVRMAINEIQILQVGNCKDLGKEFCRIRNLLENPEKQMEAKKEAEELCQSIRELLHMLQG